MEKQRWEQIKKGMLNDGWRAVAEVHTEVPEAKKNEIKSKLFERYPRQDFKYKWYHNHLAYNCCFIKLKAVDVEVVEPVREVDNEQRHLDHDFYRQSHNYREKVRRQQILKGAEKYPEPFTPESWSDEELVEHTMMENVDQGHYIVGLGQRIANLRKSLDRMHSFHIALRIHLDHGYSKVKGHDPRNPLRINYERTMSMIQNLIEEGESIGRNEKQ